MGFFSVSFVSTAMPIDVFKSLHHLPDLQPRGSDHYNDFESLYGTDTSEVHRPSLQSKRIKGHDVPFSPSTQHAKNSGIVINCTECQKPRVLHSEKKLSQVQNAEVMRF